ncbi:putative nucleic acid-binding protein [Xenococcus sp. PCC 7305]|uniref:type II toxin-antitoxin system VapC family toxin n=1 Tax=Xenococcus sp. PCC 7305 TaxID=102125 RepID=UPI0002AC6976|nr:type II toxin-antitoxin system VapC family toxin [Xenococcus sp. PCC 7305]ELS02727.1 putative nucleic acid-binding protein [Xenococcus sp. PCC 7305]
MSYLLDTNILLRAALTNHPLNAVTVKAVNHLLSVDEELVIAPQNLIESWNVLTRPQNKNGFGLSPNDAQQEIEKLKITFTLLPDTSQVFSEWEKLVMKYQVKGVNVHDTRLVAFMLVHKISHILTFNTKDFQRFNSEIIVVHPDAVENQ